MRSVRIAALAALTLIGAAGAAQAATDGVVDLGPAVSAAVEILAPIAITGAVSIGGWLLTESVKVLRRIRKSKELEIDAGHRAAIEKALRQAATYAVGRLDDRAKGGIPIAVKSQAIEIAAEYAIDSVPDALKHFGISPERLKSMAESRLTEWVFDPDDPESILNRIRPLAT